jgi:hypothetical protein
VTVSWFVATAAFLASGFGMLGIAPFTRVSSVAAFIGWVASTVLLWTFPHVFAIPGVLLDLMLVIAVYRAATREGTRPSAGAGITIRGRVSSVLALLLVTYVSAVILLRPWYQTYGTSRAERSASLFGDSLYPFARYRVDNAVTVLAPADSVWPWLAQIGQDRGGFYSYALLENMIGARIRNADSLVADWRHRHVGELVRAVPPDYLGGLFGPNVGWRIVALDSGRGLVLENWGAFLVLPIDSATTRLYIRQRNPGVPTMIGNIFAPFGLLVFEPAHFIMQRGMLHGIKRRAERRAA